MADEKNESQTSPAEQENTEDTVTVSEGETAESAKKTRTTQDVRQGHTGDHMRYVLGISFIGVVIALFAVYGLFARDAGSDSEGTGESPTSVEGDIGRDGTSAGPDNDASNAEVAPSLSNDSLRAAAQLNNQDGENVGSIVLTQTPNGVLITATFANLPEGEHAFHIHEKGECASGFSSAGGHFAPQNASHGFYDTEGPHAGDMPNIFVGVDGALKLETLNARIALDKKSAATLFDDDGAAFIIHRGIDDYRSEPAGAAGERIACGVIDES